MIENRIWLIIAKADDGSATLTVTLADPPEPSATVAVIRARGMVIGDLVATLPAPPAEP